MSENNGDERTPLIRPERPVEGDPPQPARHAIEEAAATSHEGGSTYMNTHSVEPDSARAVRDIPLYVGALVLVAVCAAIALWIVGFVYWYMTSFASGYAYVLIVLLLCCADYCCSAA
jgi:hypothetical protein